MTQSPILFPGINSNAENYFGGATATNTAAASVVTDISLSTPYLDKLSTVATATNVNLPTTGAFTQSGFNGLRGESAVAEPTSNDDTSEADYGYVDPFFIKFLAQQPDYLRQYPGLAGCLPGGPSIDPGTRNANLVATPTLATALTGTTSSTTYVSGCFNPDSGLCSTGAAPPAPSAIPEAAPTPAPPAPSPQAASQAPPSPPAPVAPPASPPASPTYNPNSLSPSQLSQLLGALQPSPSPISPPPPASTPSVSPVSPPPPTSLETSLAPAVISSNAPSPSTPATAAPTPTVSVFQGKAGMERRQPLWSLLGLCVGGWALAVL